MNKRLKVLFIDLETTPNLCAVFSLRQKFIGHDAILKERSIISASWCWEDKPKIKHVSLLDCKTRLNKDPYDDYYVVKRIHEVISQADVVVGHNVRNFDMKFVRTRCLEHGLPPFPEPLFIDTLAESRRYFYFNNNKLDYISVALGYGQKLKTGQQLWNRIIHNTSKRDRDDAIREMVKYNDHDVLLTMEVYYRLLPWITIGKPFNYVHDHHSDCPKCGAESPFTFKDSCIETAKAFWYRRYRCKVCKGWSRGQKNIGSRVC